MRPIYAIRLVVYPRTEDEVTDHHHCRVEIARRWVADTAARYGQLR